MVVWTFSLMFRIAIDQLSFAFGHPVRMDIRCKKRLVICNPKRQWKDSNNQSTQIETLYKPMVIWTH